MPINNAVMIILPPEVAHALDELTEKLQTQQSDIRRQAEAKFLEGDSPEVLSEAMRIADYKGTRAANIFLKEQKQLRKAQLLNFVRKATRTSTALRVLQYAITLPELEDRLFATIRVQVAAEIVDPTPLQRGEDAKNVAALQQAERAIAERQGTAITRWDRAGLTDVLRPLGTSPAGTNGGQRKPRTPRKALAARSDSKDSN